MSLRVTRRQASALMGGMALAAPVGVRAAVLGGATERTLVVVLGAQGAFAAEASMARSAGHEVRFARDPLAAWRRFIAPALAQGRTVSGVGDAGLAFCISQLARDGRHRFERGSFAWRDGGAFEAGPAATHLLAPALKDRTSAWRIRPNFSEVI